MPVEQKRYMSYLLRIWQEQRNTELVWHFSLENAHTNERHGFAELELLFAFIKRQILSEDIGEVPET